MPRSLVYPTTTLGRILDQSADRFGDATALIYGDARWTYRELLSRVNRMAGGLASLGVRRGERVLLTLPNCPEFVVTFFAVQKLGRGGHQCRAADGRRRSAHRHRHDQPAGGGRASICNRRCSPTSATAPRWKPGCGCRCRNTSRSSAGWDTSSSCGTTATARGPTLQLELSSLLQRAPSRPPTIEPDADRTAVLQPTGGTTGTLKLAELTHRSLLANAAQATALMGCRPGQERIMAVLPMFHVYGMTTCLTGGDLLRRHADPGNALPGGADAGDAPRAQADHLPAGAGDLRRPKQRAGA